MTPRAALATFLGGFALTPLALGDFSYKLPTVHATGPDASAVIATDVDGDGDLDLVVANRGGSAAIDDGTVTVLLNDGSGVFTDGGALDTGKLQRPTALELADFDGDGDDDLAVLLIGEDAVLILPRDATNGFTAGDKFATGDAPEYMAVADFDGENGPDIVTSNKQGESIAILINQGDGTFATPPLELSTDVGMGGFGPQGVATGDFDKNTTIDIAVALPSTDEVGIFNGNGDGTFDATMRRFAVGMDPGAVLAIDIDKDDDIDLIVANTIGDSVTVLLNDGMGEYSSAGDFAAGNDPQGLAVADVDGDGILDIITANFEANTVSVLAGTGAGKFAAKTDFAAGSGPFGVVVANLDKTDDLDIATANQKGDTVSVLLAGPLIDLDGTDGLDGVIDVPMCAMGCGPLGLGPFLMIGLGVAGLKRRGVR